MKCFFKGDPLSLKPSHSYINKNGAQSLAGNSTDVLFFFRRIYPVKFSSVMSWNRGARLLHDLDLYCWSWPQKTELRFQCSYSKFGGYC